MTETFTPAESFRAASQQGTVTDDAEWRAAVTPLFLSRNELFAALAVIGFANGAVERVVLEWEKQGPADAIFTTLNISLIVWAALVVGIALLLRDRGRAAGLLDYAVAAVAALTFLIPVPSASWLGIDLFALYLLRFSPPNSVTSRGAAILLALTIPMFWGRLAMAAFGKFILQIDATMVSTLVGTERVGNVVPFADGSGSMWFAPGCSSMTNVSLGILCAVLFLKGVGRSWTPRALLYSLLVCVAVVVINVGRISLIGLHPDQYELLHGTVGSTVAGWLTTAAILGICAYGLGREASPAA